MFTIWINLVQDLYYNLVSLAENGSLKRYFRYFFLVDNGLLIFRRSAKFQYREESWYRDGIKTLREQRLRGMNMILSKSIHHIFYSIWL